MKLIFEKGHKQEENLDFYLIQIVISDTWDKIKKHTNF